MEVSTVGSISESVFSRFMEWMRRAGSWSAESCSEERWSGSSRRYRRV